ncbi:MAG: Na/Pi symporter [Candidatus Eisenbacteria bacterium]|uniref:Na/Pi symporter n=1 Tax=Eiseniibacteriota bacterium TaxID=2212470 RepID=A0A938BMR7_UNCEI|nr:Na/Pi symporter [Candidatus Eisenbacteria bacterium]
METLQEPAPPTGREEARAAGAPASRAPASAPPGEHVGLPARAKTAPAAPPQALAGSSTADPRPTLARARAADHGDLLCGLGFLAALYAFLLSVDLMSTAFGLLGGGFASQLLHQASNPVAGLMIGLLTTSLVQSSSLTTSLAVGLVAMDILPLRLAVPIVMGANIGTTVTSTIISLGHISRRAEFSRAFSAGVIHDCYNILTAAVLFPIECLFHPIESICVWMAGEFAGAGGLRLISPLRELTAPISKALVRLVPHAVPLLLLALLALFLALTGMVKIMRRLVMTRIERFFGRVLFRNDLAGFSFGWILTALVQSSSVTTSLAVPLVGTGVLSLRKIYPYALGANIGTTVTCVLAAFALGKPAGIMVAGAHLTFNLMGTLIFYPARALPLGLASWLGRTAGRSQRHTALILALYLLFFSLPVIYILAH